MMQALRFLFQHPTLGMLGLLLSLGLGLFGLDRMQVQLMPDYKVNYATIRAAWPGVSVEGMDQNVARILDQMLNTTTGVDKVYTTAREGTVNIYFELERRADTEATLDRIEQQIAALNTLPASMDPPVLRRFDASERIARMIAYGPTDKETLRTLADVISEELRENGISRFSLYGAGQDRLVVAVDPRAAERLGLTLAEINQTIRRDLATGQSFSVERDARERIIVRPQQADFTALGEIALGPELNGLKLKDIAVIEPAQRQDLSRNVFPQGKGLFLEFRRGPDQDIIALTRAIETAVTNLRAKLPGSVTLELYGMEAYQIRDRIALLAENGALGLLMVVVVLYLFVGLKAAIWVGVGIPTVFALSFFLMSASGQSINMVSVFTMVMVIGILVDDGIVVAEGISNNGSTLEGVRRTLSPVSVATFTTVVAFAPILLLTDQIGTYVAAIPWFVCAALIASLFECFVLLPNHMHHEGLIGRLPTLPGRALFARGYDWFLRRPFRGFLRLIFRLPGLTFATSLVLIAASVAVMATGMVRFQFWLNPQSNFVFAHVTVPTSADQSAIEDAFDDIWRAARAASDELSVDGSSVIQTSFGVIGQHYTRRGTQGQAEKGSVLLELKDQFGNRIAPREFLRVWQAELPPQPAGTIIEIEQRRQGLEGPPVSITLQSETVELLRAAARALVESLNAVPGVHTAQANLVAERQEFTFGVSPLHKMLGLESYDIRQGVSGALSGHYAEHALPSGDQVEWQLRYAVTGTLDQTLAAVPAAAGGAATLADVIDTEIARGQPQIRRRDGKVSIEVTAHHDPERISLTQIQTLVAEQIAPQITADFEVTLDQGGHVRTQDTTMQQVALAFVLGLGMIYSILSLSMRSFSTPLIILAILPFGAVGMVLGHLVLGYTMTLLSVVALVGLFGVLVNDSILLFEEVRTKKRDTDCWFEALHAGYSHRLRAILLTSITTILGLLPLLLETSYQAQFLVPIAITISFGLGFSTLATLFLAPALISALMRAPTPKT